MPPPTKRPGPPVPDPDWEKDFHPAQAGAQGPESRDPLLAHAVLHRAEPEPIDLDLFDELSDLERTTVPPPEAMQDHVARMMAEASLFEEFDDTGDRPTPLVEVPDGVTSVVDSAQDSMPAALRFPTPVTQPIPKYPGPPPNERAPAQRPAASALVAHPPEAIPRREPKPVMAPQHAREKPPAAAPIAAVQVKQVSRAAAASPARAEASGPASDESPSIPGVLVQRNGKGSGQYSAVMPRSPAKARSEVPPRKAAEAPDDRPTTPTASKPSEPRIDSLDFSDLPAVFALDGLDVDDPALSEPAISPPVISPPFDSADLERAGAELAIAERVAAIDARISAGEYGPALMLAEAALEEHPSASAIVSQAESCRDVLYHRYLERLGASDHVPRLLVKHSAITALSLDHRAGFLLSCVDGGSTIEEIIDVSAMPRLDAVRILYELVQEGVIEMAPR